MCFTRSLPVSLHGQLTSVLIATNPFTAPFVPDGVWKVVECGGMWCVHCKKSSPAPPDLMNDLDQPDCSDQLCCQTIN